MKWSLVAVSLIALAILTVNASEKHAMKACTMKIDGTSTFHDWTTPVNNVKANGDFTLENGQLTQVTAMWVQAEVKSIKSEKGEDMDEKIHEALKAEDHPNITYNMSSVKSITKSGSDWVVETVGDLTMAGTKKQIEMTVKASVSGNGDVRFVGSKKIKMSQWKIKRPSAMLGTIKAGDDVTVTFDVTMKKS